MKPVPWSVVFLTLAIACLVLVPTGIYIGHKVGFAQGKDQAVVITKACPAPDPFKPKWDCSATEAKTYCSTCLRRKWL